MILGTKQFIVICLLLNIQCFAQKNTSFQYVVEPYIQWVTDTTFSVLWETSEPGKSIVLWGEAEFNVLKPDLHNKAIGAEYQLFHRIMVKGLKPGQAYFYKTITESKTGDTITTPTTPITIPDYSKMPVSFAVIGDTQFEHDQEIWGPVSKLIYQERPSFLVHVGDLVGYGPKKNDWVNEFFKPARNLLRFYPLYPTLGNHEMDHELYYRYFDLPEPKWFYTLKKGNVLFIFADTNRDILPGSYQYKKLENILASSNEDWKIMVHHHPVYVSEEGSYGNTWFQKPTHGDPDVMHLKKLYEMYGVDIVFNGHIHVYERTWPIANNTIDKKNGVTYITTGGGNTRPGKHPVNRAWYSARVRDVNHFLNINVVGNTLYGQAIDTLGNVFDSWTIEKPGRKKLNTPYVAAEKQYFIDSTSVVLQNFNSGGQLNYSLNNESFTRTNHDQISIPIVKSTNITAFVNDGTNQSLTSTKIVEKLPVMKSVKKGNKDIKAEYYEGDWIALPDFTKEKALHLFSLDSVSLKEIKPRRNDHFAVRFTGSFQITETNVYRFLLESFDGSKLIIDGKEIIANDGIHYEIRKEKFVALEKGIHNFEIQYFDYLRRETLILLMGTGSNEMVSFNKFIFQENKN